jgi:hypothetical protein
VSPRVAPAKVRSRAAETRPALTTKVDHNGTRLGPIPADAREAQPEVSDSARPSGRILHPGGQPKPALSRVTK